MGAYCVSFEGQARKSLWIETITRFLLPPPELGQARKSLWIETINHIRTTCSSKGQARKSLWIETTRSVIFIDV